MIKISLNFLRDRCKRISRRFESCVEECGKPRGAEARERIPSFRGVEAVPAVVRRSPHQRFSVPPNRDVREGVRPEERVEPWVEEAERRLAGTEACVVEQCNHAREGGARSGGTRDWLRDEINHNHVIVAERGNIRESRAVSVPEFLRRELHSRFEVGVDSMLLPWRRAPIEEPLVAESPAGPVCGAVLRAVFVERRSDGCDAWQARGEARLERVPFFGLARVDARITAREDDRYTEAPDFVQLTVEALRVLHLHSLDRFAVRHGPHERRCRVALHISDPLHEVKAHPGREVKVGRDARRHRHYVLYVQIRFRAGKGVPARNVARLLLREVVQSLKFFQVEAPVVLELKLRQGLARARLAAELARDVVQRPKLLRRHLHNSFVFGGGAYGASTSVPFRREPARAVDGVRKGTERFRNAATPVKAAEDHGAVFAFEAQKLAANELRCSAERHVHREQRVGQGGRGGVHAQRAQEALGSLKSPGSRRAQSG
mmetsp:Transcript_4430/g.15405  ORF Transcript_4430/g.15405 Transcript_4430/m.15405 type:complete len:489 (-) Transcript_4430:252-1718(-)